MAASSTNKIMHLYCIDSTGTLKYKYDKLEVQSFDSSVFLEIDDLAPDQYVLKVLQDGGVELVQVHLADYITDEELDHILCLNMTPAVPQFQSVPSLPASNPPETNGETVPAAVPAPATPSDEEKSSWTRESTGQLIALYEEMLDLFSRTRRKNVVWCELAERLRDEHGPSFSGEQCHRKWRNVLKTYRETLDRKKSGTGKVVWPYFETMRNLVERTNNHTPTTLSVDSSVAATVTANNTTATSSPTKNNRRPGLIMLPPPPAFLAAKRAADPQPVATGDPQLFCASSQPTQPQQQPQSSQPDPRLVCQSPPPPLSFMSTASGMVTPPYVSDSRVVIKKEKDESFDGSVVDQNGDGSYSAKKCAVAAAAAANRKRKAAMSPGDEPSPPPSWFKSWLEEERQDRREAAERQQRSAEQLQTTTNHLLAAVLECKTLLTSIRDNR